MTFTFFLKFLLAVVLISSAQTIIYWIAYWLTPPVKDDNALHDKLKERGIFSLKMTAISLVIYGLVIGIFKIVGININFQLN